MERIIANPLYNTLLKNSSQMICLVSGDGVILDVNQKCGELLGMAGREKGRSCLTDFVEALPSWFFNISDEHGDSTEPYFDTVVKLKNWDLIPVELSNLCIDEDNRYFVVFIRDISARKKEESSLADKNEQLCFLTDFAYRITRLSAREDVGFFLVNQLMEFTKASLVVFNEYDPFHKVLRTRRVEASGKIINLAVRLSGKKILKTESTVSSFSYRIMVNENVAVRSSLTELSFGAIPEYVSRTFNKITGIDRYYVISYVVDGELLGTSVMGFSHKDNPPELSHLRSFALLGAVSLQRIRAEAALYKSRDSVRAVLDSFTDIILVLDSEGRIITANKFSADTLNISVDEMKGRMFNDAVVPENDIYKQLMPLIGEIFLSGIPKTISEKNADKYYETVLYPIFDSEKRVESVIVHIKDVTERMLIQEELHQSEKMTAIGQLAGGIAHDFNNQLSGILGYAELVKERLENEENQRYLNNIISGTLHAAKLTKQLLSFARKGYRAEVSVDIHKQLDEVCGILGRSIDKNIALTKIFSAHRYCVKGDPSLLQSVFLNLLLNSRDAMPGGGTIYISTGIESGEIIDINEVGNIDPFCEFIKIEIRDTGSGIPSEIHDKVFEPFFTTKEAGKGTGMGLASVYGTVKAHRGVIRFQSEENAGTSFSIFLPLSENSPVMEADRMITETVSKRTLHILLVDDELSILTLLEEILRKEGHTTVSCLNGKEALKIFSRHDSEFDLVILDMIMPMMGGEETYYQLRRIKPAQKILLSSGFSPDKHVQDLVSRGGIGFLKKPYEKAEFIEIIDRIR